MMTEKQLRAQISSVRAHSSDTSIIGIAVPSRWTGPSELAFNGQRYRLLSAETELELRSALLEPWTDEVRPVVLTPLKENQLGEDLLCRFARRRIHTLGPREILRDLFKVREVEPQLHSLKWLASALADAAPEEGYPSPAQGVLDQETAWSWFLRRCLGLEQARPDLPSLLCWARDAGVVARWRKLDSDAAEATSRWLNQSAGAEADWLWAALRGAEDISPVALGLVADLLYNRDDDPKDIVQSTVRFEDRYFPGLRSDALGGRKFARAAGAALERMGDAANQEVLRADQILTALGLEARAHESHQSALGWNQRLDAFGLHLMRWIKGRSAAERESLEKAYLRLTSHRLANRDHSTREQLDMALRLVRWLEKAAAPAATDAFARWCHDYTSELSFVDWARHPLYHGHAQAELNSAFELLVETVAEWRERFNAGFAQSLKDWTDAGSETPGILTIEQVLPEIVSPLAKNVPVLFVVLDGLSLPIYRQIAVAMVRENWAEAIPAGSTLARPTVAGLPTVTEWSRRLLVTGHNKVRAGDEESALFESSPSLQGVARSNHPPVLFKKAELTDDGGRSVSAQVREAILSPSKRVVGVIINAIDDHLAKDDQLRFSWPLSQIPVLEHVLGLARLAGRAVVIASDHGHVVTHRAKAIASAPNDRYRIPAGAVLPGEIHLSAGRASQFSQAGVYVPWTERGYYTSRRNGLHGGVAPQELLVPANVFIPGTEAPDGWILIPQSQPAWWWAGAETSPAPSPTAPVPTGKKGKASQTADRTLPLFDTPPSESATSDWLDLLFASERYQEQYARVGRNPPSQETVRRVLIALRERQGTLLKGVLAQASGVPEIRLPGLLAMLRRILNVEGYPVLSVDDGSGTVRLDLSLLRTQFELPA